MESRMEDEENVVIDNKQLLCHFCGNTGFRKVRTKMNKKWMAIFDVEMFSPEGTAYICTNCGYKHEFFRDI